MSTLHAASPADRRLSRLPGIFGWTVTGLVGTFLLMDGIMKLAKPSFIVEATTKFGLDERIIVPLGVVLTVSVILYLLPRTSVLGALLLTGYLGGAIATHVTTIGKPNDGVVFPIVFALTSGILAWVGLFLRMPRLRSLLPIVRD